MFFSYGKIARSSIDEFSKEAEALVNVTTNLPDRIVWDYTFWDEFVSSIKKMITPGMKRILHPSSAPSIWIMRVCLILIFKYCTKRFRKVTNCSRKEKNAAISCLIIICGGRSCRTILRAFQKTTSLVFFINTINRLFQNQRCIIAPLMIRTIRLRLPDTACRNAPRRRVSEGIISAWRKHC